MLVSQILFYSWGNSLRDLAWPSPLTRKNLWGFHPGMTGFSVLSLEHLRVDLHALNTPTSWECFVFRPYIFGCLHLFFLSHSTSKTNEELLHLCLHWLLLLCCCLCLGLTNILILMPIEGKLLRLSLFLLFFFFLDQCFSTFLLHGGGIQLIQYISVINPAISTWIFEVWEVEYSSEHHE